MIAGILCHSKSQKENSLLISINRKKLRREILSLPFTIKITTKLIRILNDPGFVTTDLAVNTKARKFPLEKTARRIQIRSVSGF